MAYSKYIAVLALASLSFSVNAAPVEYRIIFSQATFHEVFGVRTLEGQFFIDDSILGPGSEDISIGPYDNQGVTLLTDFSVTLNGSTTYLFDLVETQNALSPPFSTVFATGAAGQLIDIAGRLTLPGSLSEILMGRDTEKGQYFDVQQTGPYNSIVVSAGTYTFERVGGVVPIPTTVWLFGSALGLLGCLRKKVSFQ